MDEGPGLQQQQQTCTDTPTQSQQDQHPDASAWLTSALQCQINGLWVLFHQGLACGLYVSLLGMYLFTHERKQKDNNIQMAQPGAGIPAP